MTGEPPLKDRRKGPTHRSMTSDLILVDGLRRTRATFRTWNDNDWRVLKPWFAGAFAVRVCF